VAEILADRFVTMAEVAFLILQYIGLVASGFSGQLALTVLEESMEGKHD